MLYLCIGGLNVVSSFTLSNMAEQQGHSDHVPSFELLHNSTQEVDVTESHS